jgi:hypothetical protein
MGLVYFEDIKVGDSWTSSGLVIDRDAGLQPRERSVADACRCRGGGADAVWWADREWRLHHKHHVPIGHANMGPAAPPHGTSSSIRGHPGTPMSDPGCVSA